MFPGSSWKEKHLECSVAIIGAGPYGLSAAAYLRAAGVEARVFGHPMAFWDTQMPAGMHLRSNWAASHIADPGSCSDLGRILPTKRKAYFEADPDSSALLIMAAGISAGCAGSG